MKSRLSFGIRFLTLLFVFAILNVAAVRVDAAIQLQRVLQGLSNPVYVTHAHDGTQRLFVIEQPGRIQVLASGASSPTLFLDITSRVLSGGERGLLGLAFHPQFATNSRFFVDYTRQTDGATVIAEYHAGASPAATAASENILLVIPQPFENHNGGMIEFGPDGYLYIGMGDGGSANDPGNRAQNINTLLGKILRIDVDHPAGGLGYSSPPGNPYLGATPGLDEIYAIGMRNPFRFSFDRQTGQLYVGDVGQNAVEEVDIVTAGGNYGWRVYEGTSCTNLDPGLCTPTNYIAPIAQYGHSGGRCSIIGGYVYRGTIATLAAGTYVFGDYCSGEIFSLAGGVSNVMLDTALNITSLGEDEAGEVYVVGQGGTVDRIVSVSPTATTTMLAAAPNPSTVGTTVTFTATVTGANPTGTVNFTENGSSLNGCSSSALTGAGNTRTAVCAISTLAQGVHSIVASYSGDAGNNPSASSPLSEVVNAAVAASATFVASDRVTQGNWKGRYGAEGYAVIGESTSYPSYASVAPSGKSDYTWEAQPDSDPRATQRGVTAGRIAACWYSGTSFNVDISLTDANIHRVTLYFLDWDTTTRAARVDVLDAGTQQVLATQTVTAYHDGVHLSFDLRGHVIVRVTNTGAGATNAVLSAIFFDSPTSVPTTSTTLASSANPATPGDAVTFTATVTGTNPTGSVSFTENGIALSGCGAVALTGSGNSKTAACTIATLSQGTHSIVASYGGDAGNAASSSAPLSQAINAASAVATFVGTDTTTQGNWQGRYGAEGYVVIGESTSVPAYAQVTPSGKFDHTWEAQPDSDLRALQRATTPGRIAATWYSSTSFNIDINLSDSNTHRVSVYPLDWDTTTRVARIDVLDANTQQVLSTQTVSSYHNGIYFTWDLRGHVIVRFTNTGSGATNTVLSGVFFDPPVSGPTTSTALASSPNPATVGSPITFTATVTGTNPTGNVSFTEGGNPLSGCGAIALTGTGNSRTAVCTTSSLGQGSHSIVASYGGDASNNPSASAPLSQVVNVPSTTAATFVTADLQTQGNWKGRYGVDGYAVIGDTTSYPSYVQVAPSGKLDYTWAVQPDSDPRALQRGLTPGRIAATWYSGTSFDVDLNIGDSATHRVSTYLLDWDTTTRSIRVDALDAGTGQVLATQTVSSYHNGVYLVWDVRGHVTFRFTNLVGATSNAVLSGIFFDPTTPPATFVLSGSVSAGGNPLAGVYFSATGGSNCFNSDGAGSYTCTVPQGWSGTVTPVLTGYNFTPAMRSYGSVAANQPGQNYAGSAIPSAATAWSTFGRDAQHTALSTTAAQSLNQVHWQTPVDLQPQYSGSSLLIHYGSPVITVANTVIIPVKTGAAGGFRIEARAGTDGSLKWSATTDYVLPPHSWVPVLGPTLTGAPRVYYPGAGGTIYFRDQPDAPTGSSGQVAFYGLANYQANRPAYDATVMINTPLTSDPAGNIYFGFQVIGSNPLGLTSGIARISASGQGTWTPVTTAAGDAAMTKVPLNSAPALSVDLGTLYVAVSDGTVGYVVALDSTTLAPIAKVRLRDPKSGTDARLSDNGSASPTVGPDGDVYFGVLESPPSSNNSRGWLLHFNGALTQTKTPGAFGWDDTASLVPKEMVPSYQGASAYLLMVKYNNYASRGGDGQNKLAVLDPNATQTDPVTQATVMKEVLTIVGPTPEVGGGVKEWCINSAAVDPMTKSIIANNEDGKVYRWDLVSNTLSQTVVLTAGLGEAYTTTVIGVDGRIYATNNATLFSVGQ